MRNKSNCYLWLMAVVMLALLPFSAFASEQNTEPVPAVVEESPIWEGSLENYDVQPFQNEAAVVLNDNIPDFFIREITTEPYVSLSPLDELGRTGTGMACLSSETLPTESRGQIGNIEPSGWQTTRYDDLIEDKYLYNRCHVLGYQLCGDNATPENLFTGTRYLNADSMLFFENKVADYLNTHEDGHVIYRVTPVYDGADLVATGVQMEAFSVDDYGKSVCFNVFVYNIQPGVEIDYSTGESSAISNYVTGSIRSASEIFHQSDEPELLELEMTGTNTDAGSREMPAVSENDGAEVQENESEAKAVKETDEESVVETTGAEASEEPTYILNTNTGKFHYPDCSSVTDMKDKNKEEFFGTRDEAIDKGYKPCGRCNP